MERYGVQPSRPPNVNQLRGVYTKHSSSVGARHATSIPILPAMSSGGDYADAQEDTDEYAHEQKMGHCRHQGQCPVYMKANMQSAFLREYHFA